MRLRIKSNTFLSIGRWNSYNELLPKHFLLSLGPSLGGVYILKWYDPCMYITAL